MNILLRWTSWEVRWTGIYLVWDVVPVEIEWLHPVTLREDEGCQVVACSTGKQKDRSCSQRSCPAHCGPLVRKQNDTESSKITGEDRKCFKCKKYSNELDSTSITRRFDHLLKKKKSIRCKSIPTFSSQCLYLHTPNWYWNSNFYVFFITGFSFIASSHSV